ncbi:MAG: TldD/PmbA family protein [Euryarchaeota archaeon]|nr:TldD/PmbA family protein [Euryarchaeota archaeon]
MDMYAAIKHGESLGADYVEIRHENLTKSIIELRDGVFHTLTERKMYGYGVRVLVNGAWGFTSTSDGLKEAVEEAYRLAQAASRAIRNKIALAEVPTVKDRVRTPMRERPGFVPLEEKIEHLRKIEKLVKKEDFVKSSVIRYEDGTGTARLLTSEGTEIEWDPDYLLQSVWLTGIDGPLRGAARSTYGSVDEGWETFEHFTPESLAENLVRKLKNQMHGVPVKRGEYPIVAGPIVVGIIAHEALGHLAEADLTMNTPFSEKIGEQIAPEFVNMSDRIVERGFGNAKYDHEGVPVRDVHIIENGVLKEIMLNREYAKKWDMEPNGHARAESYSNPPIIRMRNTVFEPGEHSFEELIEDIKFGYYLVDFRGGQAELNSSFQVGVQEGYVIENGELGAPIKDTSISGIAIEVLKNIDALGKDFDIEYGICGKGQNAFVSSGGPHMKIKKSITIGGEK